jgi:hypothetical protein
VKGRREREKIYPSKNKQKAGEREKIDVCTAQIS